ncbi:hypothetical protein EDEG_01409 [Edhazardia aedis USNM 41457]|uniref:Uncharacterized protein n=1 Tax=Edhazardia aedis (strain USNM 41457) TaxID=1003232 RepID=J9D978_EDHAE|nr:hypothetical protein EDEG_01409 [Edhazardia aedis USNM 41457]|eukprot:EJW04331.1 hypothetical protein EDEG_01409 [Edhazardia aedis USNM 41457]
MIFLLLPINLMYISAALLNQCTRNPGENSPSTSDVQESSQNAGSEKKNEDSENPCKLVEHAFALPTQTHSKIVENIEVSTETTEHIDNHEKKEDSICDLLRNDLLGQDVNDLALLDTNYEEGKLYNSQLLAYFENNLVNICSLTNKTEKNEEIFLESIKQSVANNVQKENQVPSQNDQKINEILKLVEEIYVTLCRTIFENTYTLITNLEQHWHSIAQFIEQFPIQTGYNYDEKEKEIFVEFAKELKEVKEVQWYKSEIDKIESVVNILDQKTSQDITLLTKTNYSTCKKILNQVREYYKHKITFFYFIEDSKKELEHSKLLLFDKKTLEMDKEKLKKNF